MLAMHTYHQFDFFFFFNDTATTEIYTLSLHDALPIFGRVGDLADFLVDGVNACLARPGDHADFADKMVALLNDPQRSEEHTSELQSRLHLVCRLLLEKKKKNVQYLRLLTLFYICCTHP